MSWSSSKLDLCLEIQWIDGHFCHCGKKLKIWKKVTAFVRMVIAINRERILKVRGRSYSLFHPLCGDVRCAPPPHFCRFWWLRSILICFDLFFWPRGNCHVFYSQGPRPPLFPPSFGVLAHCCPLFGLPSGSRCLGAFTAKLL
jgi:hypothetical protein